MKSVARPAVAMAPDRPAKIITVIILDIRDLSVDITLMTSGLMPAECRVHVLLILSPRSATL